MIELKGKYNSAKIFTDVTDEAAIAQVMLLLNQEFVSGSKIRLMPDIHAGAGCTIGTTMTISDKIVPNLVGVDIGCGVEVVQIREKNVDLRKLDKLIYDRIPSCCNTRKDTHRYFDKCHIKDLCCKRKINLDRAEFTTIHNYIDTDHMILRKGAVSAKNGERLIIPINMKNGSLICTGKGNDDWNQSAPHGAGRLMSRSKARESFTVSEFKTQMEGIYTTSVSTDTLDECPMAYKDMNDIVNNIGDTVTIEKVIRPIYNFKAGGRQQHGMETE